MNMYAYGIAAIAVLLAASMVGAAAALVYLVLRLFLADVAAVAVAATLVCLVDIAYRVKTGRSLRVI